MIPEEISNEVWSRLKDVKREIGEIEKIMMSQMPNIRMMSNKCDFARSCLDKVQADLLVALEMEQIKNQNHEIVLTNEVEK